MNLSLPAVVQFETMKICFFSLFSNLLPQLSRPGFGPFKGNSSRRLPLLICCSSALILLGNTLAPAQPTSSTTNTAYEALRTVGTLRDTSYYERLMRVTGLGASPQPRRWVLLFSDAASPTGLREIQVERGRIVSDRPGNLGSSGNSPSSPMDLKRLNLNSDGAFTIVEAEARENKVGFNSINLLLSAHDVTKQPVWFIDLIDARGSRVATSMISAETGRVLRPPVAGSQHTYTRPVSGNRPGAMVNPARRQPPPPTPSRTGDGFIDRVARTMDKTAQGLEGSLVRFGDYISGRDRSPR